MKYPLEERTARFAEDIMILCKKVKKTSLNLPILEQLIRSATSIGANYMEANGASSKKDFRNKIFICKKESMETKYWLRILAKSESSTIDECRRLWSEVHQLTLIFSKICKTLNK
jgi:four helix bundle protein